MPCVRSIPHLNKLHEKFFRKGLTIVGVTNESSQLIRNFIEEKSIQYVIAIGGANGYQTRGIPHAWLVGATGKVVWEGHPANLTEGQIEEELKNVRLGPHFELPRELKKAELLLNAERYAQGIKELEDCIEKPKDETVAAEAKKALETILEYGRSSLKEVDVKAEEGRYDVSLLTLSHLGKGFKGHEIGDQARDKLKTMQRDSATKAEMDAAELVVKAQKYLEAGGTRQAAGCLVQVLRSSKYEGTKMRAFAEELLEEVKASL